MEKEELIPTQQIGQQTDAEEQKAFSSRNQAEIAYRTSTRHLLNVNNWHKISPIKGVRFQLVSSNGEELFRMAKEKDFIRIDIDAENTHYSKCHAWVCIEHFEKFKDVYRDIECTLVVTRPSNIPGNGDKKIAHFLSDRATSTFIIFRTANVLNVEIHGRNQIPNNEGLSLVEFANNLVVDNGSEAELCFKQWHCLVCGILG